MRFFLDNMISPKFAHALQAVGKDVHALREKFPEETPDEVWIQEIGREGWVLLTVDRHIRTRPLERLALSKAGIISLFLGPFFLKGSFPLWEQFVWLVRHWSRIEATAGGLAKGTCMALVQNGKMHPLPRA